MSVPTMVISHGTTAIIVSSFITMQAGVSCQLAKPRPYQSDTPLAQDQNPTLSRCREQQPSHEKHQVLFSSGLGLGEIHLNCHHPGQLPQLNPKITLRHGSLGKFSALARGVLPSCSVVLTLS